MNGRSQATAAWVLALGLLMMAGLGFQAWREQRGVNREILSRLDEVRSHLDQETERSRDLAGQVTALADRVARLEQENRDLRRQVAALLRRKPTEVVSRVLPAPLDAVGLLPISEYRPFIEPLALSEPLTVTMPGDWLAYQPAGLLPASFDRAVARGLSDPGFIKKMYVGFAVLQAADVATTLVGVQQGAQEINPFLGSAVRNPAALIAIKGGVTIGTIYTMEWLRLKSPVAVAATMAAVNSTLAVVAVNNVRVIARQK